MTVTVSNQIGSNLFVRTNPIADALSEKYTGNDVLNILELATLWHLPSEKIKTTGIAWGTKVSFRASGKSSERYYGNRRR